MQHRHADTGDLCGLYAPRETAATYYGLPVQETQMEPDRQTVASPCSAWDGARLRLEALVASKRTAASGASLNGRTTAGGSTERQTRSDASLGKLPSTLAPPWFAQRVWEPSEACGHSRPAAEHFTMRLWACPCYQREYLCATVFVCVLSKRADPKLDQVKAQVLHDPTAGPQHVR